MYFRKTSWSAMRSRTRRLIHEGYNAHGRKSTFDNLHVWCHVRTFCFRSLAFTAPSKDLSLFTEY